MLIYGILRLIVIFNTEQHDSRIRSVRFTSTNDTYTVRTTFESPIH